MKVRQLVDLLLAMPQELEVKISSDPEGNGFYGLSGHGIGYVESPVDRWYHEDLHDEDDIVEFPEDGDEDPYVPAGYDKVLVLWP